MFNMGHKSLGLQVNIEQPQSNFYSAFGNIKHMVLLRTHEFLETPVLREETHNLFTYMTGMLT